MSVVRTWAIVFGLVCACILIFYVSQPFLHQVLTRTRDVARSLGINTTGYEQQTTILFYLAIVIAPIFIIVFIVWGLISSQRVDPRSEYY